MCSPLSRDVIFNGHIKTEYYTDASSCDAFVTDNFVFTAKYELKAESLQTSHCMRHFPIASPLSYLPIRVLSTAFSPVSF